MNYGLVLNTLGKILMLEAAGMLFPLAVSAGYGQSDTTAFAISFSVTILCGYALFLIPSRITRVRIKEGLMIVSLSWLAVSVFGCLPLAISGSTETVIDAFFESVSGFTTTGATIFNQVENLPKGILLWRSFSHWIGGMGILVFTLAVLPALGVGSFQVFKAESPGPVADRIVPKLRNTAKILYFLYIGFTVVGIILLAAGGMPLFDSIIHTFGTVGTGGFSSKNASISTYGSSYIHIVISTLMLLCGINFSLYYGVYRGHWKDALKDEELRFYLGVVISAVFLIGVDTAINIYHNFTLAFRDALFQTSSIITTTGYVTADYEKWTTFSQGILFLLMFFGGCAGSTAGSVKVVRILLLVKMIKREFLHILHPRAVIPVRLNGKKVSEEILKGVASFIALYLVIFALATLVITLDGISLLGAASAVATTLGNVGTGFAEVGPGKSFSDFSTASKLLFSLLMLLGRLELYTMSVLFIPKFWKNDM